MIRTILAAAGAACMLAAASVLTAPTASSDPVPTGCFESSVLDSTACVNYTYTGDVRWANYGYSCGHDIDANAQECLDGFRLSVPSRR